MSFTVTAQQTAAKANGMSMTLKVVTGAAGAQPGTVTGAISATPSLSITPGDSGSWVYGSILGDTGTYTVLSGTTTEQDSHPGSGGLEFIQFRSTATTTAGTPETLGYTASANSVSVSLCEILAATTLAEDASSPVSTAYAAAETLTTAAFSPPAGALLVLMVATNGGSGTTTVSVTDTSGLGLTWVQQSVENGGSHGYSAVWTAQISTAAVIGAGAAAAVISGSKKTQGSVNAPVAAGAKAASAAYSPQLLYYPGIIHPVLWPIDYASNEPAVPLIAVAAAAAKFAGARVSGDVLKAQAAAASGSFAGTKTAAGSMLAVAAASAEAGGLPTGMVAAAAAFGTVTGQKEVLAALAAPLGAAGAFTPQSARLESFHAAIAFSGTLPAVQPPPPVPVGSWWGLDSIIRDRRREYEQWTDIVIADGGVACPRDGEPLSSAPPTRSGASVIKFCRFCGWEAPRDVVPPRPHTKMGRNG